MGLLSNRIRAGTLKAGDHIYTWRGAWVYAHHGIYAGNDKVIHFTRGRDQEVGTATVIELLFASSVPASMRPTPCLVCSNQVRAAATATNVGVTSSCLSCFLAGGALYRFEYAVTQATFFAKVRGGTCTVATADPDEVVIRRANYLLRNGFGSYNLLKKNCENFAIYCKTGRVGNSGQAVSGFAATATAAIICVLLI